MNLGINKLVAGDNNKDGLVQLLDMVNFSQKNGKKETDIGYELGYDYNEDGIIQLEDSVILYQGSGMKKTIINKGEE